jgi:hypothetical protein
MSYYPFDGDIAYGWRSFGRSFAVAGGIALLVATVGFSMVHRLWGMPADAPTQWLGLAMQWVGAGLGALLIFAALGSAGISRRESGDVEVTEAGVRRIYGDGRVEFLALEQIDGLMARPSGGVVLMDHSGEFDMIVPRSIEGYRDCIAELKAMGIQSQPVDRKRVLGRKKKTTREKWRSFAGNVVFTAFALTLWDICRDHTTPTWGRVAAGAGIAVSLLIVVLFGLRRKRREL